jgi:two-component system, chemotaxis family, sensor kinase Cph1
MTNTPNAAAPDRIDLTTCDREAIHIPGTIQPHGVLFALSGPDLHVTTVSANAAQHLNCEAAILLGRPLKDLVDDTSLAAVTNTASVRTDIPTSLISVRLKGVATEPWSALIHKTQAGTLLEAKLPRPGPTMGVTDLFNSYEQATRALHAANDTVTICTRLAEEIRRLTDYDRVKVYRFHRDWHGEVIAESNNGRLPSYLGLHFPASDIPAQARELYRRNLERQIPDVAYTPVALIQADPEPLDLSVSVLRSVSPIHIEYLRNMQVGASMSVSILRHGELWGLVACHHHSAHYVSAELRQAGVLLSQLAAWQLTLVEEANTMRRSVEVNAIETTLLQETTSGRDYRDSLLRNSNALLELMQASGLALSSATSVTTLGATPSEEPLRDLLFWLSQQGPAVLETDHLAHHYPPAAALPEAAGILVVPLGGKSDNLMVWFRPEIARTVSWGGDPAKPVEPGTGRLNPRNSFATWTQDVHGQSRPWARHEIAAANSLRDTIVDIILRRSLELEQINAQLMRSNEELEAFAYVASHDLKEPLRQIETFSTLLERVFNNGTMTNANPTRWFEGIQSSSRRLRLLIDDLTEFSRIGRHANPLGPTAFMGLLDDVKTDLGNVIEATGATIDVTALPVVMCDRLQMQQVLQNVLSNALKYRHPDRPPVIRVEAKVHPAPTGADTSRFPILELAIADNGIGFDERYRERIFEPFQRLHSSDDYEGSGIGLAICRKIVDRHGGTIRASSRPSEGSVFSITLPMRPLPKETDHP